MTAPHDVSLIGLGIMGRRMLHHMGLHEKFRPVCVWDPDPEACDKARAEQSGIKVARSATEAITAADCLYIACPPVPRRDYALEAAAAGKALFLEKPLGVDLEASRHLVAELERARVPAAVNFVQASGAPLIEITRAMGAGEAGPIRAIDIIVTYPAWPRAWQIDADWLRFRAEGGYTREVISHFVFVAERLVGPTEVIWARPSYPDDAALCETHILARLESADGVPVSIFGSVGGVQPDRQEVTVTCEWRGYKIAEFFQLHASDGGPFAEILERPADPRRDGLARQLNELDKCLRGEDHLLATPQEGLNVQSRIETMLQGAG